MKTLEDIRLEIDAVDRALAPLLARRMALAEEVAAAKRRQARAVNDPGREQAILARATAGCDAATSDAILRVYRLLFDLSKERQRQCLAMAPTAGFTVAVVGLGLIGGSFYKASRRVGYETVGLHHGDDAGFETADAVLVCLPPDAIVPWIAAHAERFKRGAVVLDICGTKRPIAEAMAGVPRRGWHFVGGHPMAGREVSGFDNALAHLFVGASMILTPDGTVPAETLARLKAYLQSLGFALVLETTPARHDEMIAFTSQLCHIIATAYVRDAHVARCVGFTAGSYANMTRIATQDDAVWSALYLENRDMLLPVLDGFVARLAECRAAIAEGDAAALRRIIRSGTTAKRDELSQRLRGDENV